MRRLAAAVAMLALLLGGPALGAEPLPSWNDGPARRAVLGFVERVTKPGPEFVRPGERIAVFDNDGTLWSEQPMYVQLAFALERVKALAPAHPEWKERQPFRAALENDLAALAASGEHGLLELVMATHAGMSTDEFARTVRDWLATARHPRFGRPYPELVYQPMLELLAHLRENGFQTWIVSGGGVEFVRAFAEETYGVPSEQVVGSTIRTEFQLHEGSALLARLPELEFFDDKAGKPVGIQRAIGRRPLAAFGNSDGDLQMLQWTALAPGPRLALLVRHTDAQREWAYDRRSSIGRLDAALDEAAARGWTVLDMKRDWKVVYPFELRDAANPAAAPPR